MSVNHSGSKPITDNVHPHQTGCRYWRNLYRRVLESEAGFQSTKVLTTLNQPEIGVMQGIDELLRLSNIEPGQITHVIHGTTLGTNTVIERKGQKQHS